ncbi:hypothetical protein BH09ACT6_BH09ACT6_05890 [soil metagenome]
MRPASTEMPASSLGGHLGTIRISTAADEFISRLGEDLVVGKVELWQLPSSLFEFWNLAWSEGAASRQPEIDQANADADRLYQQLYSPRVSYKPGMSFDYLERIRHEIYYAHELRRAA